MSGGALFDLVFYLAAAVLVASSLCVAFSRNLIYSAFGLMGTLGSVAVLFVLLAADFLAVTQILIYIGGILVLILFAIMLTGTIRQVRISNRAVGWPAALAVCAVTLVLLMALAWRTPWLRATASTPMPTAKVIGDSLLSRYILPFEAASMLLLIAAIGAVLLGRKEMRRP